MDRISFIGLGAMGRPMAANLLAAGWRLSLYNRTPAKAEGLPGQWVTASSPAEAVRDAEAVISMLADDKATEAIAFGPDGILAHLPAGAVHISMSTIGAEFSKSLALAHAAKGQGYVAAPVFGRPEAAGRAALWIVAGGASELVERCRPLFGALGQGVHHVSERPEAANVVKLAGNFTIASMLEVLGEAFALVEKSGVDPRLFLEIINGALFKSPLYENYGRLALDRAFEPAGFKLKLGLKDVSLALAAGSAAAVPMPVASALRDNLLSGMAQGKGELDWSALVEVIAERAGIFRN